MSAQISEELMLLLMSAYGGLILILCYDAIRIWRRIFKASLLRVIVEELVFWTIASVFMFHIFLEYNYGRPRYFAIGTTLGVMALFEWLVGRRVVDKLSLVLKKILNSLLKPLKKIGKVIKLKCSKLCSKIRKRVKKCPEKEEQHKKGERQRRQEAGQHRQDGEQQRRQGSARQHRRQGSARQHRSPRQPED